MLDICLYWKRTLSFSEGNLELLSYKNRMYIKPSNVYAHNKILVSCASPYRQVIHECESLWFFRFIFFSLSCSMETKSKQVISWRMKTTYIGTQNQNKQNKNKHWDFFSLLSIEPNTVEYLEQFFNLFFSFFYFIFFFHLFRLVCVYLLTFIFFLCLTPATKTK